MPDDKKPDDKKPEIKPEEIDALANDALTALGFKKPDEKKPDEKKKPEAAAKKDDDDKSSDDAAEAAAEKEKKEKEAADKAAAEKKKVPVTKKPAPKDDDAIATAAAKKALAAQREEDAARAAKDAPKNPPPAGEVKLDKSEEKELEIAKHLEAVDPEKYKNAATEMKKFLTEVLAPYKQKWLKDNPGESFDPESTEHEDIYAKQPEIDPDDWDEAKIEYRAEKKVSAVKNEMSSKLKEFESKHALEKHLPKIEEGAFDAVKKLVKDVDADLAKHLDAENPYEAMVAEDPIAAKILDRGAAAMRVLVTELDKLSNPELEYAFDGKNNAHVTLSNFADDYQAEIKAMPEEEQVWNGKKFATQEEYSKMSTAERENHWVLSGADMRDVLISRMTATVKKNLEAAREEAAKSAGRKRGAASDSTPDDEAAKKAKEATEAAASAAKPKPPSTSSSGDIIHTEKGSGGDGGTLAEAVVNKLFGS